MKTGGYLGTIFRVLLLFPVTTPTEYNIYNTAFIILWSIYCFLEVICDHLILAHQPEMPSSKRAHTHTSHQGWIRISNGLFYKLKVTLKAPRALLGAVDRKPPLDTQLRPSPAPPDISPGQLFHLNPTKWYGHAYPHKKQKLDQRQQ